MRIKVEHEKELSLSKLSDEIDAALGRAIPLVSLNQRETKTKRDDRGGEVVEYIGYEIELKDAITPSEEAIIAQVIDSHVPDQNATANLSLESLLKRIEILEKAIFDK